MIRHQEHTTNETAAERLLAGCSCIPGIAVEWRKMFGGEAENRTLPKGCTGRQSPLSVQNTRQKPNSFPLYGVWYILSRCCFACVTVWQKEAPPGAPARGDRNTEFCCSTIYNFHPQVCFVLCIRCGWLSLLVGVVVNVLFLEILVLFCCPHSSEKEAHNLQHIHDE